MNDRDKDRDRGYEPDPEGTYLTKVELLGGPLDGDTTSMKDPEGLWPRVLTIPLNPRARTCSGLGRVESTLPLTVQVPKFYGTYIRGLWDHHQPVYIWQGERSEE